MFMLVYSLDLSNETSVRGCKKFDNLVELSSFYKSLPQNHSVDIFQWNGSDTDFLTPEQVSILMDGMC